MTTLVGIDTTGVAGYTTAVQNNGAPTNAYFMAFTASASGTATTLNAYLTTGGGFTTNYKLFIADSSRTILAISGPCAPSADPQWVSAAISSVSIVSGTTYNLGFYADNNDNTFAHWNSDTVTTGINADTSGGSYSAPESTLSINATGFNGRFAMYADGTIGGGSSTPYPVANAQRNRRSSGRYL